MQKDLLHGLVFLGMQFLVACAATDTFETDADRCRNETSTSTRSAAEDFRLPQAMDEALAARVAPPPKDKSAYALCMRSRGWTMDENGRAVEKGLSAEDYSQLLAKDLTVCARGSGEENRSTQAADATQSSAARVVCTCLEGKAMAGITSVDLRLVIGEGGSIRHITALPASPVATCLQESLPGAAVAAPPSAPWKATVRILHYQ